ncbi:ceramide-1-phosphate transfer protein [Falco naumanni]|nr:ceramide-1-phosphate transfer protein [Falco naumanni]
MANYFRNTLMGTAKRREDLACFTAAISILFQYQTEDLSRGPTSSAVPCRAGPSPLLSSAPPPRRRNRPRAAPCRAAMAGAFSLREVLAAFQACVTERREVLLGPYLSGWRGLIRFLHTLGAIFSFISKDAVAKVQLMEDYCRGEQREQYVSLQAMVRYELAQGLLDAPGRPDSGCRTVLRLHRALRWLQLFLEGLRTARQDSRTSTICTDSYNASLAAYHPWVIRKAATVAFRTLPPRDAFLQIMNVGTAEEAVAMLGEALPYIGDVYDITQQLFAQHELLDLP